MAITFEDDRNWDGRREAVRFNAFVDGRRVVCLISLEALEDHFEPNENIRDERDRYTAAYDAHKRTIQDRAAQLIGGTGAAGIEELVLKTLYF
jgi:hypothetical protein